MKPAIFNTEMVKAIRDGRKTQTRRVCKVQPRHNDVYADQYNHNPMQYAYWALDNRLHDYLEKTPYKVGDIIYVRETFNTFSDITMDKEIGVIYKADNEIVRIPCEYNRPFEYATNGKWKPSIHMPKEAARLFLRVKDVRIERLNEISEEDAKAEGTIKDHSYEWSKNGNYKFCKQCAKALLYSASSNQEAKEPCTGISYREKFKKLWESIYGNGSFDNRYVWVIEFERISKEEAING